MWQKEINNKPMLNAYPDSMGGNLNSIVEWLKENQNIFSSFYILPSVFNSDLDRGFSVIDYNLNKEYASMKNIEDLKALGIELKLDFVLNHISVNSPQFQDILVNGEMSKYREFFIPWNDFWEGHGEMTKDGYIQPDEKLMKNMFFRKPGLPILMVEMPDGKKVPYWNTFYQQVWEEDGKTKYLGQMDLNIKSQLVWDYYKETVKKLAEYGTSIIRLDAFAYAPKEVGEKNFMNEPGTWDLLEEIHKLAKEYDIDLLPEIHTSYNEKTYDIVANKGYMIYDFFLPGLIIDILEGGNTKAFIDWTRELYEKKIKSVNMLGCHDGIPMLDLKGILSDARIEELIQVITSRGGMVKNLHGAKNIYYQINATYFSALGECEDKMLLARALQLFVPGKPQVWYLDLFVGKNDYAAVEQAGEAGHKEINRTNLSMEELKNRMKEDVVQAQLKLLSFRNQTNVFDPDSKFSISEKDGCIIITWKNEKESATLCADLKKYKFTVEAEKENLTSIIFSNQ